MPKDIFYLLKGDYRVRGKGLRGYGGGFRGLQVGV